MPRPIPSRADSAPGTALTMTWSAASPNALISRTQRASLPPWSKVEWAWRMRTAMGPYARGARGSLGRRRRHGLGIVDVDDVLPRPVGLPAPDRDAAELLGDRPALGAVDGHRRAFDQ